MVSQKSLNFKLLSFVFEPQLVQTNLNYWGLCHLDFKILWGQHTLLNQLDNLLELFAEVEHIFDCPVIGHLVFNKDLSPMNSLQFGLFYVLSDQNQEWVFAKKFGQLLNREPEN